MELVFAVLSVAVMLSVAVAVATSVAAVSVVKTAAALVTVLDTWVLLVAIVAATAFPFRVHLHRLLRMGSLVAAGKVRLGHAVPCLGLCRCCRGLGPVAGQSLAC